MKVYELVIEDLTTLGRMGDSATFLKNKLFKTEESARKYADDYVGYAIDWTNRNYVDCGHVGMQIYKRKVQK